MKVAQQVTMRVNRELQRSRIFGKFHFDFSPRTKREKRGFFTIKLKKCIVILVPLTDRTTDVTSKDEVGRFNRTQRENDGGKYLQLTEPLSCVPLQDTSSRSTRSEFHLLQGKHKVVRKKAMVLGEMGKGKGQE